MGVDSKGMGEATLLRSDKMQTQRPCGATQARRGASLVCLVAHGASRYYQIIR